MLGPRIDVGAFEPPEWDPAGERPQIEVLRALSSLRISTWNSQALLGSMFSQPRQVSRKRGEFECLLARSEVVVVQETHGPGADVELLPTAHRYLASFGELSAEEASSLWGVIVIGVAKSLVARVVGVSSREVVRGRVLQVGLLYHSGGVRFVCVCVWVYGGSTLIRRCPWLALHVCACAP